MPTTRTDRIMGAVMAAAIGDAFGAPYEGGILERILWALIGKSQGQRRWTDDTQMMLDVMASLTSCGGVNQNDLARRFAASYHWSRGYGPGAAKILKRIRQGERWELAARSVFKQGSFGNGGAMRTPAVGLFYAADNERDIVQAAKETAAVTHGHPLAQEGAALIALTTALTLNDDPPDFVIQRLRSWGATPPYAAKLELAERWLKDNTLVSPKQAAAELGNGIAAAESCVTAIYLGLALIHNPLTELLDFAVHLSGDVDTISAMASAIWGAAHGYRQIPDQYLTQIEDRDRLLTQASAFAAAAENHLKLHDKRKRNE